MPGPTLEASGLDVGFADDEPGAVAAAVSYATAAQRWLYFTDDEIRAAVDRDRHAGRRAPHGRRRRPDVSMARDQLGESQGPVWWLVRPLAWRVETSTTPGAGVGVDRDDPVGRGVAAPQSEFLTVTLDLCVGRRRLARRRRARHPGPTPMTGPQDQPWDAEPFDETLEGFTRIDGEPVQ
jgi:hypothetical protein